MNPEKGPGPVPQKIGKYIVEKVIGRGAMGVVYLAQDPTIDRPAALKTIHVPEGLSEAQVKEFRERFLREARAAGRLSHSAIVTVYEAYDGSEGGLPFIAMEYVEGTPWNAKSRGGRPRDPLDILPMVRELASALDYAHRRGVVHRDVKPANVMETPDGHVKLMDFGIARVPTSELTQEGQCPGTPAYSSPEQVRGEKVDGRSDLFSLGAVLYELLTCQRAFSGDAITSITYQIVAKPVPLVRDVVPSVNPEIDQIIQHLTAKEAGARYASGRELMEDIDAYMAGASLPHAGTLTPAATAPAPHQEPPPRGVAAEATPVPSRPFTEAEEETVAESGSPTPPSVARLPWDVGATAAAIPSEDAATVPAGEGVPPIPAPSQKPHRYSRPALVLGLGALLAILAVLAVSAVLVVWIAGGGLREATAEPDLTATNRLARTTSDTYVRHPAPDAVTEPPPRAEAPKPKPRLKPKPKPAEPEPAPVQIQPAVTPPQPPPPPAPATVNFSFKTGIVKGEFWIKTDQKEAIHKVISRGASLASETYTGSFQVPPGAHTLTFEVRTEIQNVKGSHEEQVTFQPGQMRTLRIVMTKFNKELRFEWGQ